MWNMQNSMSIIYIYILLNIHYLYKMGFNSPLEICHFQHFLGFLSKSPCKFLVSSKMHWCSLRKARGLHAHLGYKQFLFSSKRGVTDHASKRRKEELVSKKRTKEGLKPACKTCTNSISLICTITYSTSKISVSIHRTHNLLSVQK